MPDAPRFAVNARYFAKVTRESLAVHDGSAIDQHILEQALRWIDALCNYIENDPNAHMSGKLKESEETGEAAAHRAAYWHTMYNKLSDHHRATAGHHAADFKNPQNPAEGLRGPSVVVDAPDGMNANGPYVVNVFVQLPRLGV